MSLLSLSRSFRFDDMLQILLAVVVTCVLASPLQGGVIVVTNRSDRTVSFRLTVERPDVSQDDELVIDRGDCFPIPLSEAADLSFSSAGDLRRYRVVPSGLYYFFKADSGETDIGQIGLETPPPELLGAPDAATTVSADDASDAEPNTVVVPVKVLFDDSEIMTASGWEARIRKRFEAASRIFKKTCFTEFRIVAVESWDAGAGTKALLPALNEFEKTVEPAPAQVAIGFLGQRIRSPKDGHLGGTRGPLAKHLLVFERANKNTERECLELLVHELGHYLGAVHSPEVNSVMRPVLGDRYARSPRFRIVFDPLNTLAMCLVSQELHAGRTVRFEQLGPETKAMLTRIYCNLHRANPKDPAASHYLGALRGTSLKDRFAPQPREN